MLNHKQRSVLFGMVLALLVTLLGFVVVIFLQPNLSSFEVLRWDLLPLLCLVGNIGFIARHRFFHPEDIDGGGLTEGSKKVRLYQSTLQNTLEQTVLALPIHALWALTMPMRFHGVVVVSALFFFVGRLLFWRGYSKGAGARSFGFALTFYPSALMLILMTFAHLFLL